MYSHVSVFVDCKWNPCDLGMRSIRFEVRFYAQHLHCYFYNMGESAHD
jgi:hypothetical protein